VSPKKNTAIVQGENLVSKHIKANTNPDYPKGEIIQIEAPIHLSNLMLIDPKTNKPTRTSRKSTEDGKSVRVSKKSGEIIG
jgi:large subunit ribosomal protein L24